MKQPKVIHDPDGFNENGDCILDVSREKHAPGECFRCDAYATEEEIDALDTED